MKEPTEVKIGPISFQIKWSKKLIKKYYLKHGDRVCGYMDSNKTIIVIDPKLSRERKREVLMHEITHACSEYIDKGEDISEEDLIISAAPFLLQTFQDNPLVRYFLFC